MLGPDLPAPHELFDVDTWLRRWPSGTHRTELCRGVLVFSGEFDHRDVEIAQRAYPGRQVVLNEGGGIEIHPGNVPPPSIFKRRAHLRPV
ncbi:hypothetical protein [Actinocrispum wychmicini]|uniref:Uncharacterized protein n=1 Tax=Actinocrispum wychmicini TaxID=1213861 RepID=A0A4R2IHH2_9PSEU|nr:hypothetical protein [Actinocrispum wychmicini]TCO44203.1 hypothetical protein EV192_12526 [Actinocrispum wychmicini]